MQFMLLKPLPLSSSLPSYTHTRSLALSHKQVHKHLSRPFSFCLSFPLLSVFPSVLSVCFSFSLCLHLTASSSLSVFLWVYVSPFKSVYICACLLHSNFSPSLSPSSLFVCLSVSLSLSLFLSLFLMILKASNIKVRLTIEIAISLNWLN